MFEMVNNSIVIWNMKIFTGCIWNYRTWVGLYSKCLYVFAEVKGGGGGGVGTGVIGGDPAEV